MTKSPSPSKIWGFLLHTKAANLLNYPTILDKSCETKYIALKQGYAKYKALKIYSGKISQVWIKSIRYSKR
jgi:hypothetical protein